MRKDVMNLFESIVNNYLEKKPGYSWVLNYDGPSGYEIALREDKTGSERCPFGYTYRNHNEMIHFLTGMKEAFMYGNRS